MNPSILTLLSAGACAAGSLAAQPQAEFDPEAMPRVPYEPHLIVRLLPGHSVAPIAAATGSDVVWSDPRFGLHLLATPSAFSAQDVESLASAIKGLPTVIYAEADEPTDPPEIADCGPGGDTVGVQQCTIAFIDSAPLPTTVTHSRTRHWVTRPFST